MAAEDAVGRQSRFSKYWTRCRAMRRDRGIEHRALQAAEPDRQRHHPRHGRADRKGLGAPRMRPPATFTPRPGWAGYSAGYWPTWTALNRPWPPSGTTSPALTKTGEHHDGSTRKKPFLPRLTMASNPERLEEAGEAAKQLAVIQSQQEATVPRCRRPAWLPVARRLHTDPDLIQRDISANTAQRREKRAQKSGAACGC